MINLMNDYNSPGHPAILKAVTGAANEKFPGYGTDGVCREAKDKIKALLKAGDRAEVHFLVGGTQANVTAIGAFLRPHEAVIAPDNAHINVHETGAIEASGHKILLAQANADNGPAGMGKLTADGIRAICLSHTDEHMVKPRLVYISQSTELGGVYTLSELKGLRRVCDEYGLLLYLDGARLSAALASRRNDAQLPDIASLCDAFYIGGTKNGLLFGEALVIMNESLKSDFRFLQKQRGGLLAKGFLLGLQFDALFTDGLFFDIAGHACKMADKLRSGLEGLGCGFFVNSATNQLFPIFPNHVIKKLAGGFLFEKWAAVDGSRSAIRFVTSWNTTNGEIDELLAKCALYMAD